LLDAHLLLVHTPFSVIQYSLDEEG